MPHSHEQRNLALHVVNQLRQAGFEALWAGGCVRDQLLNCSPDDYDVATNARPEQVRDLFGKRRTLAIGAAFGVIVVLGKHAQAPVEVATFRSDGAYIDGRRPTGVIYTTAEEDAQRRDFTINGMFYNPITDEVIDYVGGQADLEKKIIRAIGDAPARFSEDKLRMLRAVRFATTLGFQIEAETLLAIQKMAAEVAIVSAERIGAELRRMLVHKKRYVGIQLLQESQLLPTLFPEIASWFERQPTEWQGLLERLKKLTSDSLSAALAALLYNIELEDEDIAIKVGHRFRFTNKEIDRTSWLLLAIEQIADAEQLAWPQLQRLLIHQGVAELMALAAAIWGNDHAGLQECKRCLALPITELNPEPLVTGKDLIAHGIPAGPFMGRLLEQIRDQQLLGEITTREQALQNADRWLKENRN